MVQARGWLGEQPADPLPQSGAAQPWTAASGPVGQYGGTVLLVAVDRTSARKGSGADVFELALQGGALDLLQRPRAAGGGVPGDDDDLGLGGHPSIGREHLLPGGQAGAADPLEAAADHRGAVGQGERAAVVDRHPRHDVVPDPPAPERSSWRARAMIPDVAHDLG